MDFVKKKKLTLTLNMANNEIISYEKAQAKEWNMTGKEWKSYEKVQAKEWNNFWQRMIKLWKSGG